MSHTHSLWPSHPQPSHSGPALLYCPGKVEGLLSQVLQQVKGRAGLSCSDDLGASQLSCLPLLARGKVVVVVGTGLGDRTHCPFAHVTKDQGQFFHVHTLRHPPHPPVT